MYVDKQLEFSDAQAITNDAASTNIIDTKKAGRAYPELYLVCQVHTTFDSAGGNATLTIKLQTDDNDDFSSATDIYTSAAIAEANLVAGAVPVKIPLPSGLKRYIRLYYDNGTEAFTAGKMDAFLAMDPEFRHVRA